jgi:hypothetical protein
LAHARSPSWLDLIVEKSAPPSLPKREPDPLPVRRRWRHDPRFVVAPAAAHDPERLDVRLVIGAGSV